jgi:hypothetical protein
MFSKFEEALIPSTQATNPIEFVFNHLQIKDIPSLALVSKILYTHSQIYLQSKRDSKEIEAYIDEKLFKKFIYPSYWEKSKAGRLQDVWLFGFMGTFGASVTSLFSAPLAWGLGCTAAPALLIPSGISGSAIFGYFSYKILTMDISDQNAIRENYTFGCASRHKIPPSLLKSYQKNPEQFLFNPHRLKPVTENKVENSEDKTPDPSCSSASPAPTLPSLVEFNQKNPQQLLFNPAPLNPIPENKVKNAEDEKLKCSRKRKR